MRPFLLLFFFIPLLFAPLLHAEEAARQTPTQILQSRIVHGLGLPENVKSDAIRHVLDHTRKDTPWAGKIMSTDDLYGNRARRLPIRTVTLTMTRGGQTIIDTLSYNPRSGLLILSEVHTRALSIEQGVRETRRAKSDEKLVRVSESPTHAIFHIKGTSEDVAYSLDRKSRTMLRSQNILFSEILK